MDKLKSCPFCGGKAEIYEYGLFPKFYVCCEDCGCYTAPHWCEEYSIEAWNRRVEENGGVH